MQIQIEKVSSVERRLTISVPVNVIDAQLADHITALSKEPQHQERFKQIAAKLDIQDIKNRKLSLDVLKESYNEIADTVLNNIIVSAFRQAIKHENLFPVGSPAIDVINSMPGQPLEFVATFEILPLIEDIQVDLTGIKVEKMAVTEQHIESSIEFLRTRHMNWIEVTRPIQETDRVVVDFDVTMNGQPVDNGSARDYSVYIGTDMMIQGFEAGLLGAHPGDTRILDLTFPAQYEVQAVAGKPVQFTVKIKHVYRAELPPVDEALMEKVGILSRKKEDLIHKIRANLEREFEVSAREKLKQQVFERLVEQNQFDVPKSLIEQEIARLEEEQKHDQDLHGHYEEEEMSLAERAEKRVRISLLIKALLSKYKMKADPKRIDAQLELMTYLYKDANRMIAQYKKDAKMMAEIELIVLEDQLIDVLMG